MIGTPLGKGNFSQNQFGGTIGGHILHDRFFYFGDYQGLRSTQSTTVNSVVPSAAMKTGDLREVTFNPVAQLAAQTGCIVNKVVQSTCIDPVALCRGKAAARSEQCLRSVEWHTELCVPVPAAAAGSTASMCGPISPCRSATSFLRATASLTSIGRTRPGQAILRSAMAALQPTTASGTRAWRSAVTTTLSSTAVNQFRWFGWGRDSAHSNPIGVTLGTSAAPSVGLTGIPVTPQSGGLPPINISGGFRRIGVDLFRPQFQAAGVWQYLDNFTKLTGNHSLLFGYEYHRTTNNFLDLTAPQGYMGFSGIFTGTNGFGFADFLLGNVNQTFYNSYLVVHNYQFGNSFFAQDTWRAAPKLTVVYGTRYELYSPTLNRTNSLANFNTSGGGGLTVASDGSWAQRALVQPDKNNFAPRVGFSYQAGQRMVLRGGFGVFYQYMNRIGSESQLGQNQPFLKFVNDARTTVASGTVLSASATVSSGCGLRQWRHAAVHPEDELAGTRISAPATWNSSALDPSFN